MLSLEIIYYLIDYSIRLLGGMCSYGEGALIGFLIGTLSLFGFVMLMLEIDRMPMIWRIVAWCDVI